MRIILLGLLILTVACSPAPAGILPSQSSQTTWSVAQYQGDTHTRTDDRPQRPQRYVCVVPPPESDDRDRPYVCRADAGRVGGRCRCPNVVGNGRLDLDY
jgi:hypothetical protein